MGYEDWGSCAWDQNLVLQSLSLVQIRYQVDLVCERLVAASGKAKGEQDCNPSTLLGSEIWGRTGKGWQGGEISRSVQLVWCWFLLVCIGGRGTGNRSRWRGVDDDDLNRDRVRRKLEVRVMDALSCFSSPISSPVCRITGSCRHWRQHLSFPLAFQILSNGCRVNPD